MAKAFTLVELVDRVPKGERTDSFNVQVALFVLGAIDERTAVSTSSVEVELTTRLRRSAPRNCSDALRRSAPNVDCVKDGGRKLRWFLTSTGQAKLRTLLNIEPDEKPGVSRCDVAIVCALHRPELKAVLQAFGGEDAWQVGPSEGQPHIYKQITAKASNGTDVRFIAGAPTHMGLTATAIIATQMILLFRPRLIVMVGIAAGTRSSGRNFGDILIADPSVDYASGKIATIDGADTFQPDSYPIMLPAHLRTLVQEDARRRTDLDVIKRGWTAQVAAELAVHIGALGAADQVVDSPRRVAEAKTHWRKLIGFEMETYALYRAAHEAPGARPMYISFKSVCDFATEKTDTWQEYAAFTAAEYARRFILRNWGRIVV